MDYMILAGAGISFLMGFPLYLVYIDRVFDQMSARQRAHDGQQKGQ